MSLDHSRESFEGLTKTATGLFEADHPKSENIYKTSAGGTIGDKTMNQTFTGTNAGLEYANLSGRCMDYSEFKGGTRMFGVMKGTDFSGAKFTPSRNIFNVNGPDLKVQVNVETIVGGIFGNRYGMAKGLENIEVCEMIGTDTGLEWVPIPNVELGVVNGFLHLSSSDHEINKKLITYMVQAGEKGYLPEGHPFTPEELQVNLGHKDSDDELHHDLEEFNL